RSDCHVTREAAGINGNRGLHADTFAHMILRRYSQHTLVSQNCLLDSMAHTHYGASSNGTAREMLVETTYIQDAGNGRIIMESHFTMRGDKNNLRYRMIQIFRDREGLHIAHPASPTRMDGIADFVLAFQYYRS